MRFFQNANYDFLKYRKHWAVVSTILSLLGLSVVVFHKGLNVGIDFAGGTQVVVQFLKPPTADDLRKSLAQTGLGDAVIQGYGAENPDQFMIRTRLHGNQEEGQEQEIIGALDKIYNPGSHPAFDINKGGAEGLALLLFENDPPYALCGEWAAYVAVVLTKVLADTYGIPAVERVLAAT